MFTSTPTRANQEMMQQEEERPKTWSRREFTKGLAATAATAATVGFSFSPWAQVRGQTFDFHTHITQQWGNRPAFSVKDLLQFMDENEIEEAAVSPLVSPLAWDHPVTTDYVLEQTKPHRDRLISFCAIDPRSTEWGRPMVDKLKQYIDAGARGFGEHKVGLPIDHPLNMELFAACGEVGLPVLFHLDSLRNTDEPGLPGLEKVLQQVPETNMVGHAQGWWASISGDMTKEKFQSYPDQPVKPGGAIDRLMENYPNIYGDLGAGSGANAIMRDLEFGREFLIRRADRLVFGTDVLEPGQDVEQIKLYGETLDLPKEVEQKIFWKNAHDLLLDR
jgi:predicted TIM-barrel fold metal-dependent hydrolase